MSVEKVEPGKVVVEKLGCNAVEAIHPTLEATVEGVGILDVVQATNSFILTGVQLDMLEVFAAGDGSPRSMRIRAEYGHLGESVFEHGHRLLAGDAPRAGQPGHRATSSIPCDENTILVVADASLRRLPATLPRLSPDDFPAPFL